VTRTLPIVIGAILLLVLVLFNTTYTVRFHELAVRTRFGELAGVERDAGLHFKAPFFVDQVTKLDTRLQLIDSPLETVMTADQQQVVVQAYLLWRIKNTDEAALKFYGAFRSIDEANRSLEQQLQGALRAIGSLSYADIVGAKSRIADAEKAILGDLKQADLAGIEPVSVGIAQVLLPPKATGAVLARMGELQNTIARNEETRGNTEAEAIKAAARTQADIIRGFAEAWAQRIAARGDQEAARYYEEMAKHRDLATFLTWLDTLKAGMTGAATIFADTTRAPFHLLDLNAPTNAEGVPMPTSSVMPPEVRDPVSKEKGTPKASASNEPNETAVTGS
jgi:membrane protease subunit HflC